MKKLSDFNLPVPEGTPDPDQTFVLDPEEGKMVFGVAEDRVIIGVVRDDGGGLALALDPMILAQALGTIARRMGTIPALVVAAGAVHDDEASIAALIGAGDYQKVLGYIVQDPSITDFLFTEMREAMKQSLSDLSDADIAKIVREGRGGPNPNLDGLFDDIEGFLHA